MPILTDNCNGKRTITSEGMYSQPLILLVKFMRCSLAIDCCQAMEAYDRNPHNSSIAQLLPCLNPQAAAEALDGAKRAIKTVIRRSNSAVDLLNRQEQRLAAKGVIDHATIVPHVCDPFGPEPSFFPVGCSPADGSFIRFEEVRSPLPFKESMPKIYILSFAPT
jgi:hypothetical protein